MILDYMVGLVILLLGLSLMFITVPKHYIIKLLGFGIIGGFGVALTLIYIMQNVFKFWVYNKSDILVFNKIPLLLSMGWLPTVITFAYLFFKFDSWLSKLLMITIFSLIGALTHYVLILNNMLVYNNWSLLYTFLIAFFIHIGLVGYLYITNFPGTKMSSS